MAADTFIPDVVAPELALLDRVERLIKDGCPGVTRPSVPWTGEGAPHGHWLLPAGTKIHRYEDLETPQAPAVVLDYASDPSPHIEGFCETWDMPLRVSLIYTAEKQDPTDWAEVTRAISRLLAGMFPGSTPAQRLTGPGLRVFHVSDFAVALLALTDERPAARYSMTVFCAGDISTQV